VSVFIVIRAVRIELFYYSSTMSSFLLILENTRLIPEVTDNYKVVHNKHTRTWFFIQACTATAGWNESKWWPKCFRNLYQTTL